MGARMISTCSFSGCDSEATSQHKQGHSGREYSWNFDFCERHAQEFDTNFTKTTTTEREDTVAIECAWNCCDLPSETTMKVVIGEAKLFAGTCNVHQEQVVKRITLATRYFDSEHLLDLVSGASAFLQNFAEADSPNR